MAHSHLKIRPLNTWAATSPCAHRRKKMRTLAECKTDGERLGLLLDFEPGYGWLDLLVRGIIYFALLATAGTVVMAGVMAILG